MSRIEAAACRCGAGVAAMRLREVSHFTRGVRVCVKTSAVPRCRRRSFRPDTDRRHHASGLAELGAVREEARSVARGASLNDADVLRAQPGVLELTAAGLDQVEVQFGTKLAVAGSPRCQEQHRIANVNGVGVEDLFEEIAAIPELRVKLGADLGTNLITTAPDGRPDGGAQVTRLARWE